MKKLLIIALTVVMLFSVLAGCTQTGDQTPDPTQPVEKQDPTKTPAEEPTPEPQDDYGDTGGLTLPLVENEVKLTWMLVTSLTDVNDKPIIKELEKRTGINLDIQAVPSSSYAEKLKITMGSGNLPDLLHGASLAEVNQLGAQGALTVINEYADSLPNFKKLYMEENDWVMKSWTDDEGNLYGWPIYGVSRDVNHGFMYRKDIFDANDIPAWNTTEEFYDAMKQLKEIYPDSVPYASKTQEYIFRDWGYGWGVTGSDYPMYYDEGASSWKFMFTQPEFKEMIDFMKKMYDEGLLDPEFVTDTDASWTAKMTSENRAFVTYDWIGRLDMFHTQVKDQMPEYDLRYANPIGPVGKIRQLNKVQMWGHMVPKNANNEVALKLLDYLSSPSGSALITLGIEDEHYVFGADGKVEYPNLDVDKVEISVLENEYGGWLEGMYMYVHPQSAYFNYTEKEQEAQDMMVNNNKIDVLDPILKFTNDETETKAELTSSLLQGGIEFATKYVIDKNYGDTQWEAWLSEAESLKVSELEEIFNNAQARYNSGN